MTEKEFEDVIDMEEEALDINVSTFGKFFPAKNLKKVLGDSICKDEIIIEYIKAKIEKIKQQKTIDKEDTIILKLYEAFELIQEIEENPEEDFTTQYLNIYDEKEILLKLMMMIEMKFKDSLDTALDLIIGQSFSGITED